MPCALRHAAELKQHNGWSKKEKKEGGKRERQEEKKKDRKKKLGWATKKMDAQKNQTDKQSKNEAGSR